MFGETIYHLETSSTESVMKTNRILDSVLFVVIFRICLWWPIVYVYNLSDILFRKIAGSNEVKGGNKQCPSLFSLLLQLPLLAR